MTMRAMDDVKESCRVAAATTMRTLQSVTLRLADPAATAEGDAAKAVNMMLPFMLDKCKRASAPSVKAVSPPLKAMFALEYDSHFSHAHLHEDEIQRTITALQCIPDLQLICRSEERCKGGPGCVHDHNSQNGPGCQSRTDPGAPCAACACSVGEPVQHGGVRSLLESSPARCLNQTDTASVSDLSQLRHAQTVKRCSCTVLCC